jgi:glycosyltransferase involved in cell wall biosynthesis
MVENLSGKIISSFHHSFAGGSKNTCRLLNFVAQTGVNVDAYFFEKPQFFEYSESTIRIHLLKSDNVTSQVIDEDLLKSYLLTAKIVDKIGDQQNLNLFACNLFPYGNIMLDAKAQIQSNNFNNNRLNLILHPTGSDIWQIGPNMKNRVKWVLDHPMANSIITYSSSFAEEIKDYYEIDNDINILPPVLESHLFFPLSETDIKLKRNALGFHDEDFIIHHHSSMRKIKCPEIVLQIAIKASQLISRKCILFMVGPIPHTTIKNMNIALIKDKTLKFAEYKSTLANLTIYWTGILSRVQDLLQISDLELNTSLHDSFNISLMEAMACGIPVVTSEIVGIREHIRTSNSGYFIPTKKLKFDKLNELLNNSVKCDSLFDIDYAVSTIESVSRNQENAKAMGKRGAKYVSDNFNFEKIWKQLRKYLK